MKTVKSKSPVKAKKIPKARSAKLEDKASTCLSVDESRFTYAKPIDPVPQVLVQVMIAAR